MKNLAGTPGTMSGFALRVSQFVFAGGSIASMATTSSFFDFTAYCYLIAAMGLLVIWSCGLTLLDAYALFRKKLLQNSILISLFVVGDWVTATLSLAAASASAGVTLLLFHDLGHCGRIRDCEKFQMSVALAFLAWFSVATSSIVVFLLLAAG